MVHVSQLADRFVKDPREVVKAGDIVTVKVVEVDLKRRRIALTMKLQDAPRPTGPASAQGGARTQGPRSNEPRPAGPRTSAPRPEQRPASAPSTAMAAAFGKLSRS
jgi:uncharacterized protein